MGETDIVTRMLQYLDGWVLDNQENEELAPTKYNKKVTAEELENFHNTATDYACSYVQKTELSGIEIADTAVALWGSGLIWNKYNLRSNDQVDETNTLGYGDKLIVQAKEMLKPYKSYSFSAY